MEFGDPLAERTGYKALVISDFHAAGLVRHVLRIQVQVVKAALLRVGVCLPVLCRPCSRMNVRTSISATRRET